MAEIPDSARQVIESGKLAHLVTLSPDGSSQVTVVWVGLDGDEIVSAHLSAHQKVKSVRRDPRVSLSIATDRLNASGLTEYLVVYGHARITEGGAPELLQRLAHVYLGPDVKFPPMDNPPPGTSPVFRRSALQASGDGRPGRTEGPVAEATGPIRPIGVCDVDYSAELAAARIA